MEQGIKDKVERLKDKVERLRMKAKVFLDTNTKAFIVDINNNFYFCDIVVVDENFIKVFGFAGTRKDQGDKLFYVDILRFEEYEEQAVWQ